jgi:adenylate cyclase
MTAISQGKYIGTLIGDQPTSEADHFYRCKVCGGWVDYRNLGKVFAHEGPLPHPERNDRNQIRESMAALASGWRKRGYALGFGASIAGGYATIGTIGFEERLDYGAIGTVCNLAARLCGEANDGQILISARVFAKMELCVEAMLVGELSLKGFHRPVGAYNVLGIRSEASG